MTPTFTCTSNDPYDKHNYEIVLKTNKKVFFDRWESAQGYWFTHSQIPDFLDYVIVLDKSSKKSKAVGF